MPNLSNIITLVSRWAGSSVAVVIAATSLVAYIIIGFVYGFTDKLNLIMNTIMSAISYILLFVIQYTQDREARISQHARNHNSKAAHIKLDEIIHALKSADNKMMGTQHATEEQLEEIEKRFDDEMK